jgi:DNA topoisomerase-1
VTGQDGESRRASVPDDVAPDELTVAKARELLESQGDGDRELGIDPASGRMIVAKAGRYGPYVTEVLADDAPKAAKPRTGSLFKTMQVDSVSLEDALRLLSLPRVVGSDPADGEEITAQNGRYGPYLRKGTDSRSLTGEDQIFDITLDEALVIYAQPRQRGRAAAAPPLRELGADPVSAGAIVVKDGRFGPYVTDGTTNATLRKGDEVETITLERAAELLAEKRARGPVKRTAKKSGAKKVTATKTTATKTTAKKTTAKKTAAKKTTAKKTTAKKAAAT